jgi:hypothetical protein
MAIAKPEIAVAHLDELVRDHIGQLWSPATVSVAWPAFHGLPAPSIEVKVIALSRPDLDMQALNKLHLQAAHDILNAALLSVERMMESSRPVPSFWHDLPTRLRPAPSSDL